MVSFDVNGIVANTKSNLFSEKPLVVGISNDEIGKSLSIWNPATGVMMEISIDNQIEKALLKAPLTDDDSEGGLIADD